MGLLNYALPESQRKISYCQEIIAETMEDNNRDILLYKDEESDNFAGILLVEFNIQETDNQSPSTTITIHRYGVVPSYQDDQIDYMMYSALRIKYPKATIIGVLNLSDEIARWSTQYDEELTQEG